MIPTSSKVPWVGENPFSSASTPKISEPPFLGLAVDTPLGWEASAEDPGPEPLDGPEADPEPRLARTPPVVATTASPAPVAVPRARKDRRSMRSVNVPPCPPPEGFRRRRQSVMCTCTCTCNCVATEVAPPPV